MLPPNPIKKAISDPLSVIKYIKNRPTLPLHLAADVISRNTICTHIFEKEWDLLVVLDGLRLDTALKELAESDLIKDVDSIWSVGSHSSTWINNNFRKKYRDEINQTSYITANPHSKEINNVDFVELREVWKSHWNTEIGTVLPHAVTDEAIRSHQANNQNRIIVHYMQPHFPSLSNPELGAGINLDTGREWDNSIWSKLDSGELTRDIVYDAYKNNLHDVLPAVQNLCASIDAENAILTSDHGNLFGEWGIYGHPQQVFHYKLRRVPWFILDTDISKNYSAQTEPAVDNVSDKEINERLSALGYK